MARIRYLKPDFFLDEDIAELPHGHRIAFQGLWCYADREGRLEDKPKKLKALIFPYEPADFEKILNDLTKKPFIIRYLSCGKPYIQIVNFKKHQKPHHTEKPSEIPEPQEDTRNNRYAPKFNGDTPEGMGMEKGMGMGNGEKSTASPSSDAIKKEVYKKGLNIYALINRLNNDRKSVVKIPDSVIDGVCRKYLANPDAVENQWAWFMRVLNAELDQHNANMRIAEHAKTKKESFVTVADLLRGAAS